MMKDLGLVSRTLTLSDVARTLVSVCSFTGEPKLDKLDQDDFARALFYCAEAGRKRDEFEPYVEGPWDDYVAALTNASSWGDELTLQASAEAWDVVVHVVTSSDEHYYLMYGTPAPSPRALFTPRAARRKRTAQRHCFLTYTAPVHYDVLSAEPVPPGGDVLL
ncbi:thiol-dependent ubiquitin-specific protease [Aureococcus anophagefferens]|nr:thiol-dependent ubiquitin-specific protease [Aureococcus anophagefferens]